MTFEDAMRPCPSHGVGQVVMALGPRRHGRWVAVHQCLLCHWHLDEVLPANFEAPPEPPKWMVP